MKAESLSIPDVKIVTPVKFEDSRGFFSETYNRDAFRRIGIDVDFVQDNHSRSERAGTLRGLHFQTPPYAQAKLVRALRGAILDVAVDLRRSSTHYGRHVKHVLTAENGTQIFIPEGFAHGFITLEPGTEVAYKTSNVYSPKHDRGLPWDDPVLCIDWGWTGELYLSDKDKGHSAFEHFLSPFI